MCENGKLLKIGIMFHKEFKSSLQIQRRRYTNWF